MAEIPSDPKPKQVMEDQLKEEAVNRGFVDINKELRRPFSLGRTQDSGEKPYTLEQAEAIINYYIPIRENIDNTPINIEKAAAKLQEFITRGPTEHAKQVYERSKTEAMSRFGLFKPEPASNKPESSLEEQQKKAPDSDQEKPSGPSKR